MKIILMAALNTLKKILLRMLTEKFLTWMFFWALSMLVESTKTTKDNDFLAEVKKLYEEAEHVES